MNDTTHKQKWSFLLLPTALCLLLYPFQLAPQTNGQFREIRAEEAASPLSISENILSDVVLQKAQVLYNRKGLKDEILIEGCLRELRVTSKTKEESIEELIEHVSVWIPKLYSDNFLVNPRCIIILETKINEAEKAEVRFGVAMKCTAKWQVTETINI